MENLSKHVQAQVSLNCFPQAFKLMELLEAGGLLYRELIAATSPESPPACP